MWRTPWPGYFRKLIEAGWKLDQIRAVTVGQWFGVMRSDGPGTETVIEHRDGESLTKWANVGRAEKGLPPLPLPSELAKKKGMKNEDVKVGDKVGTPHGPGEVIERETDHDGWIVQRADGLLSFYHSWDLRPAAKAQPPTTA